MTMAETIGTGLGTVVSRGLGALISGFGDYKVSNNTLLTGGLDPPEVINAVDRGGVVVRHREYLQDIAATTAFTITSLPLNPGLVSTFPWLSNVAQHFEQYKFRGVLFEFKTLSSDTVLSSATSSALGSVVMATQYNALLPAFPDKFTMENYEFANSSKPSISFLHPIECQRGQTTLSELYVRGTDPPANSDLRLYDLGNFYIATVGMQAASGVAGELWVTYEVELYKPKIQNPLNVDENFDHWTLDTTATNTDPFLAAVQVDHSTMTGILDGHRYYFPVTVTDGVYLLAWHYQGTSAAIAGATVTVSNCTGVTLFTDGSQSHTNSANTTSHYFDLACVDVTASPAYVNYASMTLPTSPTSGDFYAIQLPSTIIEAFQLSKLEDKMETEPPQTNQDLMSLIEGLLHRLEVRDKPAALL